MASSHNVELEAAKFLHKLIQESTDEPVKLATKLYVILQHMKASGKEYSMPYLVISRAMETVITRNGLDIEALKSSQLPLTSGTQVADSATAQYAGSSQAVVGKDSKADNEMPKIDPFTPGRPPAGPSSAGHDYYQGSVTHRTSSRSFDHESPSSLDSRSANSQSQERRDTANREKQVKDGKKVTTKRKRVDPSLVIEPSVDNSQQIDTHKTVFNLRKGKMNKIEPPGIHSIKGAEHSHFNVLQSSGQNENFSSLSGGMRSMFRAKQEGQNLAEKSLDSANISSSVLRNPNARYPEEVEVSSTHNASNLQQGGSVLHNHETVSSRGAWNQNKVGSVLEESQAPRFSSNVVSGNMKTEVSMQQSTPPSLGPGMGGKSHGGASSDAVLEPGFSNPMQFSGSSYDNHGLVSKMHQGRSMEAFSAGGYHLVEPSAAKATQGDEVSAMVSTGRVLVHDGGSSSNLANATKILQGGRQNSITDMSMLRSGAPRDSGKSLISQGSTVSCLPFKEQQLKQLRAQCLVFLAFRNGLMPKKLHLEIALGCVFPKEEERKHLLDSRKLEAELQAQEAGESQASLMMTSQEPSSSSIRDAAVGNSVDDLENCHFQGGKVSQASSIGAQRQLNPEMISWTGIGSHNEVSGGQFPASAAQLETVPGRKDGSPSQPQSLLSNGIHEEHHPVVPVRNADVMPQMSQAVNDAPKNGISFTTTEQEDDTKFGSTDLPPTPKYTMSEKWIMTQQEKKLRLDQTWGRKQQKTERRIARCFGKLKDTVSLSEDISAKTKSVIELKKLQLLGLQRRLRSDFLSDFFKPISSEMDRLRTCKKHRHGRRIKQLEKYEQKMKEERQKRIRERQKEFFGEIEVHKERVEDVFKIRRERWKGFNKYVKEFHKRKERIHREKTDRIQREKINLLKINDVEGYLRMVQDAKSDRVKQLLKETEKYLQKLGSKLQEAKVVGSHFENDIDEIRNSSVFEKNETDIENEDESDQAKHYMESNEKYYLMAHSIKESIAEQPTYLHGGKLREYQMNGLRWLVSLYNNHLNGILADEMGLGKTVQVIALICYLMETKNDRGPFLVVVPSSVLPGWESEINFWAPSVHKIVYAGPPEERRRLFKERVVPQKFNVLLTTYEYLMNKHDRPKLSKVHWHYIIIDEGHRIKNASCKLNADLKHYRSSHRLLLTGTPLQNNLEELWALLNFLLPNIFNSSEDFSQWFNKPFQSNGDNSPDEALLSEEENLLIINRLHQVLRPFVLRRLKHKVENELPEKIERLIRCEASAYQKLLMKRVEDNLGAIGNSKSRSVHNSVMELRNICNHPYLSQLHAEEVDNYIPKHYLPPIIRLCGKLEMLDRLLPKLKATEHRVLFFSTMTRLLDVMEEYLTHKQYKYLRLDGHTSGGDRGALIEQFNRPDSSFFIFLLSIRAGGVGVNLQAADTVIIFDTDWNPQVDLQAQARAHRIGQKRDVLVLRFETVQTVEEQVRASAEHKLGVANQSITAGFFDNDTSPEDRREYLESLLRECKKEEAAPVLNDDALNDILARSESEIDIFESVDKQRQEIEKANWQKLVFGQTVDSSVSVPPMPSRLVTDDDLKAFYEAMKIFDVPKTGVVPNVGVKRKGRSLGGLDTQHYGRGKRAREVRSYEEQWTEEEFEKLCQVESPDSPKSKEEVIEMKPTDASGPKEEVASAELPADIPLPPPPASVQPPQLQQNQEITPPSKRGRGRPKRVTSDIAPIGLANLAPSSATKADIVGAQGRTTPSHQTNLGTNSFPQSDTVKGISGTVHHVIPCSQPAVSLSSVMPCSQSGHTPPSVPLQVQGQDQKSQSGVQAPRRRGRKQGQVAAAVRDPKLNDQSQNQPIVIGGTVPSPPAVHCSDSSPSFTVKAVSESLHSSGVGIEVNPQSSVPISSVPPISQSTPPWTSVPLQIKGQNRKAQNREEAPRRRGRKKATVPQTVPSVPVGQDLKSYEQSQNTSGSLLESKAVAQGSTNIVHEEASTHAPKSVAGSDLKSVEHSEHLAPGKLTASESENNAGKSAGPALEQIKNAEVNDVSVEKEASCDIFSSEAKNVSLSGKGLESPNLRFSVTTTVEAMKNETSKDKVDNVSDLKTAAPVFGLPTDSMSSALEGVHNASVKVAPSSQSPPPHPFVPMTSQTTLSGASQQPIPVKRQGRKTTSRVEGTRRRGRNQAPILPVHTVSLAGQDPKSNPILQNKSIDSSGRAISMRSKQANDDAHVVADLVQAQGQEIPSSGTLVDQDLKRQEQPVYAVPNKQPPSLPTALYNTSGSSDKNSAYSSVPIKSKNKMLPTEEGLQTGTNPALGRIQTADVNDVARVMKEIFSGTCPSNSKIGEAVGTRDATTLPVSRKTKNQTSEDRTCLAVSGNYSSRTEIGESSSEDRDVYALPASEKGFEDVTRNQSLEDMTCPTVTILETTASVSDLPIDKHENQSGAEADAKVEDNATDLEEALVLKNNAFKVESTITSSIENMADSKQIWNESSVKGSNAEVMLTVPGTDGRNIDVSCRQSPGRDVDLAGISTGASSNLINSPMVSPGTEEPPKMATNFSTNKGDNLLNESSDPALDPSIEMYEKQCGDETDTKVEVDTAPLVDEALDSRTTTCTPGDWISNGPVGNLVDSGKVSIENLVTESTNVTSTVPESNIASLPVEIMEDSRDLVNENATNQGRAGDICTVPIDVNEKDVNSGQISPACDGDLTDFGTMGSSSQLVSPSASPGAMEPPMTTEKHSRNQADDDITGCSTEPCRDRVGSPLASQSVVDPCTKTESMSGNQVESCFLEAPAAATLEVSVDKCEQHSGTEADSNLEEDIAPVLIDALDSETIPSEFAGRTTSGSVENAACSRNLYNENLLTGLNTEIICTVPETSITSRDSAEIMEDVRMIFNENPSSGSTLEVSCVVPVEAGQKDGVSCQRSLARDGDLTCFSTDAPSNKVNSPLISLSTAEPPAMAQSTSGNNADSCLQESPDAPVVDLPIDEYEKHSRKEGDTKLEEDTSPVLDGALDSKSTPCEPEGNNFTGSLENIADLRNDLFEKLTATNQEPIWTVPDNITTRTVEIMVDSCGLLSESSIAGITTDVSCTIPINTQQEDDVSCQRIPAHDGDVTGYSTGSPCNQVSSPLVSLSVVEPPKTTENSFGNQAESCSRENPNASVMDLSIDNYEKDSGREADVNVEEANAPVLGEALNLETAPEPESRTSSGSVEKMDDTITLCIENSETERHMEVIHTEPLNVGQEDNVFCQRAPALDGDTNDFNAGICSNEVVLPLVSPSTVQPPETADNDSGDKDEPSSKESPNSSPHVVSFACPTISMETDDAISHLEVAPHIPMGSDPSCSANSPSVNENSHVEMSLKFCPDPSSNSLEPAMISVKDDGSVDHPGESPATPTCPGHSAVDETHVVTQSKYPESSSADIRSHEVAVPIKGDDVGNHPNLITFSSANPDHSGERECLGMIIDNYGEGSPEQSETPSTDVKAAEESIAHGAENFPTVNDLGALTDGSSGYNSAMLNADREGNLEAVLGGSEDKDDIVSETVPSVPSESTEEPLG